jgi:putative transposase
MGNRITRAARHLPADAVQERIRSEKRPWRRQRWEIIYQALTAPRHAEDIARTVGVSLSTVHRVIATYKQGGVAAIETPGKGGRRHHSLTLEQERAVLKPFLARAAQAEMVTVAEVQQAYEEATKQPVAPSTIYRLLERHGWSQRGADCSHAPAPESNRAQGDTVAVQEPKKWSPQKASSGRSSQQGYPSDLTDRQWAILEPLIPPAKPGGRPRSVEMREVINAIFYVDRTGCQWRALPHDFPPWSTVWTYFRTWRNDGTWERIHTALREQVRVKQGREPTPSAAIIDSQSVKTSQKGGRADMTVERKSRGGSDTSSSIRMG